MRVKQEVFRSMQERAGRSGGEIHEHNSVGRRTGLERENEGLPHSSRKGRRKEGTEASIFVYSIVRRRCKSCWVTLILSKELKDHFFLKIN